MHLLLFYRFSEDTDLSNTSLRSPEVEDVISFWREAREGMVLPHIKNLSGSNLRRWVGDISVIHLHDGPKRFFVSLHGSNVARHIGPDFNKKYLEDAVPQASLDLALAPYQHSIRLNAPVYAIMHPTLDNGLHSTLERLVMPFCGEKNDTVERFLVWVAPNNRKSDQIASIYGERRAGRCAEQAFSLYSLAGSAPVEIEWRANARMSGQKPTSGTSDRLSVLS